MYVLYGGRYTRAVLCEMVMLEGGIDYELREIDIVAGEHRTPEFLAVNPAGLVPALITPEGEMLHETAAINIYLCERHGLSDLLPGPDDPQRGRFLSGLFYVTGELEPQMKRFFYPHRYVARKEDTDAQRAQALAMALERLAVINAHLEASGPYYLGDRFSLIDLTLGYWAVYVEGREEMHELQAFTSCTERVLERPKLKAHFETLRASNREYAGLQAKGGGVL